MDRASTLVFLDHPGNEVTRWFVRTTPFPVVNPSFAFFDKLVLAAGETLRLRYHVVVGNGAWDRARIESYVECHSW